MATVNSLHITPALASQDVITSSFATERSSLEVPHNYIAQARKAFTVTYLWGGRDINIKSAATGKVYNVQYASSIGAEVGDTVTVIIDDSERWITIINERTGSSAAITGVTRR
ncbi:hypothetical protein [Aerosakkonema funiforme]|uniref:hypothetical protein n=1 Tax=Aerosakkonema funiforme TaxID=1246630 RepID=UPI0035BC65BA